MHELMSCRISQTVQREKSHGMIDDFDNVDFILSNVTSSHQEGLFHVFSDQDDDQRRNPTTRYFSEPTELLLIGCSMESILGPKIQIKFIDIKH